MKLRQRHLAMLTLGAALVAACDPNTPKGGATDAGITPTSSTKPGTTATGSGDVSDGSVPGATNTPDAGPKSSSPAVTVDTDGGLPPGATATSSGASTNQPPVATTGAGAPPPDAGEPPDATPPSTKGIIKLRLKVK